MLILVPRAPSKARHRTETMPSSTHDTKRIQAKPEQTSCFRTWKTRAKSKIEALGAGPRRHSQAVPRQRAPALLKFRIFRWECDTKDSESIPPPQLESIDLPQAATGPHRRPPFHVARAALICRGRDVEREHECNSTRTPAVVTQVPRYKKRLRLSLTEDAGS